VDTIDIKRRVLLKDTAKAKPAVLNIKPHTGPQRSVGQHNPQEPFRFKAATPIEAVEVSQILLFKDSIRLKDPVSVRFLDSIHRKIGMEHPWKAKAKYTLQLLPGAFTDIYGARNDSLRWTFETFSAEELGQITLLCREQDSTKNYIVQLSTAKGAVVQNRAFRAAIPPVIRFKKLVPGAYKVQVIVDENGNGRWDTGAYRQKRQPERIIFYQQTINLRANWDQEIELDLQ